MYRVIVLFLLVLFLFGLLSLVACRGNDSSGSVVADSAKEIAAVEAEIGAITEIDCPLPLTGEVEGETYYCGVYTAPVNYDDPDAGSLNLTFVVLKASGDNPLPDPIVFLAGGPGQSGVLAAGGASYGDLREERDLVYPAQRGTLFSHRLALEECVALLSEQLDRGELNDFVDGFDGLEALDRTLPYDRYLAQYSERAGAVNARCHQAFATAGLDPTQFNTANSSHDLVGLMAALGYDSYNLHGTSYGTRLALETVRRHPEANIRSIVLDSPAAPTASRLENIVAALNTIVLRLFDVCEADPECNAAYPNLTERAAALLASLATSPLTAGGQTIGQDDLIDQLSDLTNTRANYIPRMIAELEAGDATTYLALRNGEVGADPPEGAASATNTDRLVREIATAAAQGADIMAGLQVVAAILGAAQEENPREAMRAVAQERLAESEGLPRVLERIDSLSDEELEALADSLGDPAESVDEAAAARHQEAAGLNNALFLQNGINCLEEQAPEEVGAALASSENLALPGLRVSDALLATEVGNCTNYPMGEPDLRYSEPVSGNIPTLILQGEFDVRTPISNGLALADQLGNATLVIVPQAGHETWTANGCVAQIGIEFIRNPDRTPDLTCLGERQERFSLPGEPLTPASE